MIFTSFYSIYSKYLTIQTENRVSLDCETRFFDSLSRTVSCAAVGILLFIEQIQQGR